MFSIWISDNLSLFGSFFITQKRPFFMTLFPYESRTIDHQKCANKKWAEKTLNFTFFVPFSTPKINPFSIPISDDWPFYGFYFFLPFFDHFSTFSTPKIDPKNPLFVLFSVLYGKKNTFFTSKLTQKSAFFTKCASPTIRLLWKNHFYSINS